MKERIAGPVRAAVQELRKQQQAVADEMEAALEADDPAALKSSVLRFGLVTQRLKVVQDALGDLDGTV